MASEYRSKIDWWLLAILAFAIVMSLAAGVSILLESPSKWSLAALSVGLGAALPLWLLLDTRYTIESGRLHIRCGPLRTEIRIAEITGIAPTRNPLSSPALSLDRLRIDYGKHQSVMVSPRDKERFLRDIEAQRRR